MPFGNDLGLKAAIAIAGCSDLDSPYRRFNLLAALAVLAVLILILFNVSLQLTFKRAFKELL